jgi:Alpha/beta hydrolase domain
MHGGSGRPVLVTTSLSLAAAGYEQAEYTVRGSARSFGSTVPLGHDGRWDVAPEQTAPYSTRIVVYRPIDRASFGGTVVLEWFNVSAGFDTAPDWLAAHNALIDERVVWIGVSAQAAGVQGDGPAVAGRASGGLRAADPGRYGALHHPGDSFSYDIFTQVGCVARGGGSPDPVGAGTVRRVVAMGESQSAFRLVTYINAIQPLARAFDGFLVHSRSGSGAPLAEAPHGEIAIPDGTPIRTDLDVPVLVFQTETDLTSLGSVAARQPDSDRIRVWEVAGSAHADAYTAGIGFDDVGDGRAEAKLLDVGAIDGGPLGCGAPINAGPSYAVLQAGLSGLLRWVAGGAPLPAAPRLELECRDPVTLARDAGGNARGGIRTPLVDVPIATLRGDGNQGESFCRLFGTTTPFDIATLRARYPRHEDYTAAFDASAAAGVRAGFLRPREAANLRRAAAGAAVPAPGAD